MVDVTLHPGLDKLIVAGDHNQLRELCKKLHPADFATALLKLPLNSQQHLAKIVKEQLHPEVLIWCDSKAKEMFVKTLGLGKIAKLLEQLEFEDLLDFIEGVDKALKPVLMAKLPPKKQQHLIEALTYPKHSAARVMEKDFIVLLEYWDAKHATSFIKKHLHQKNISALIVVDRNYRPVGHLSLSTLLKANMETTMQELLEPNYATVSPDTDLDQLTYLFKKYSVSILPVVNKLGRLVGIISVNSMLYVIDEETEEDLLYMGGILQHPDTNLTKIFSAVKGRLPWLFINLITAYITGIVINQFGYMIAKMTVLASLMPIVAALGGNGAVQVITITVRSLVKQEITYMNALITITKEILICTINGSLLALIGGLATLLIFQDLSLSGVFTAAIVLNFIVAGLVGSAIPIFFDYLEIDPAAASGVLVTAITDALGFFIFLALANIFLYSV